MLKKKLALLIQIYISFFKLGAVSFGGGYAIIPLIEKEVVENKEWINREKIIDIFSVSQALPGAIAINASTFVGYYVAGIPGAITALLGNATPSVIIVLLLSSFFIKYTAYSSVKAAFRGIYPVVVGLILYAAYKIGKDSIKDKAGVILAILAVAASLFLKLDPILVIVSGAAAGLAVTWARSLINLKKQADKNHMDGGEM